MTYFTDSPFERMMVQKPHVRREDKTPAPPKGNPCGDGVSPRDTPGSTTCYRDLIILHKKKEAGKCDL